jgi:hypothetical protein
MLPNTLSKTAYKLFEERAQLTGITEYGVGWNDLLQGKVGIPAQGARFDIAFEGEIAGDRINGKISGVDFLTVRADGRFDMNIQATITTDDGATIAFHEDGVVVPSEDGAPAELYLNMHFNTAYERYEWINSKLARGRGTVDPSTGQINVTSFMD